MRSTRTARALAAGLLAATVVATGVAGAADAAPRASACTPSWTLADMPAQPTGFEGDYSAGAVTAETRGPGVWFPSYLTENFVPSPTWVPRWTGTRMTQQPPVPKNPPSFLWIAGAGFDSASDGWVVGNSLVWTVPLSSYLQPYADRWHDGRWTRTPLAVSPDPDTTTAQVSTVASLSPSDAWGVGALALAGGQSTGSLIEHWDGRQWSIVDNPAATTPGASIVALKAVTATNIWAVGRRDDTALGVVPFTEHYDGHRWSVVDVPAGAAPAAFYSIGGSGPNDLWAVGDQTIPGSDGLATPLMEHFDGTSWRVVSDLPDLGNAILTGAYAASPDDVWVTEEPAEFDAPVILHWDGKTWTSTPWPGGAQYGKWAWSIGIAGTGPDDVWALGGVTTDPGSTTSAVELRVAHLSCGGR